MLMIAQVRKKENAAAAMVNSAAAVRKSFNRIDGLLKLLTIEKPVHRIANRHRKKIDSCFIICLFGCANIETSGKKPKVN
jgi:hypothetical protein